MFKTLSCASSLFALIFAALSLACGASNARSQEANSPSAPNAEARAINVVEHGITPGKDVTLEVNRLCQSLAGQSNVRIVFPRGQYEFYPENAIEKYRAVANHDNSLKRIAFPILDGKNITIDGNGSTFMFHGRISPLVIDGVDGVTLENFSIDWKRPFQSELTVVADDNDSRKGFVVEIDPQKYPFSVKGNTLLLDHYDWQDPIGSNIVFDPKTKAPIYDTRPYKVPYLKPVKTSKAGKNRVRIESACKKSPPAGSVLVTYGRHPTSRLAPAIHVANSRDIQIKDVTVHAAGGMGLIVERTDNIDLNHLVITSTKDRMVSTRADATHFIGCKGTIKLEKCVFEHMLDDGINVHGAYVKVVQHKGGGRFICEISHFQQWGLIFAQAGDKIAVLSRETVLPLFETSVRSVIPINQHRFELTLAKVPDSLPQGPLSMENLTWYPDLEMRNCIVRENRARSVLVTTKGKVLIENNVFSSQMHGILIEGDNNKWYESGGVQDVTIRNNVFENIGFGSGAMYPLMASPLLNKDQRMGEGHYHRKINFVNNTLKSFNGRIAHARSVTGLNLSGNTIEFSQDYPADFARPSVNLEYCDRVTIENNRAVGFDAQLKIVQSEDSTEVIATTNDGFTP